jgi:hypothetical protein
MAITFQLDPRDVEKARESSLVIDFIEKPLAKKTLRKMFG